MSPIIFRESIDVVGAASLRFVAQIVASLVRRPYAEAFTCEGRDLVTPTPPEFRKSVQQENWPAVRRTGLDNMQRNPVRRNSAFAGWNFVSSIGAYIFATGLVVFIAGVIYAFIRKEQAAANPSGEGATTLEWTLPSPPPFHQFNILPRIAETHH
jgi:hypothetical protein